MKKILFVCVMLGLVWARKLPPPPVPGADLMQKQEAARLCKVPLNVAVLPPEIDRDYKDCVNRYYKPILKAADLALKKNAFIKKSDETLSVRVAEGFVRSYEFDIKSGKDTKTLLCNDSLDTCYSFAKAVRAKTDKTKKE